VLPHLAEINTDLFAHNRTPGYGMHRAVVKGFGLECAGHCVPMIWKSQYHNLAGEWGAEEYARRSRRLEIIT
jgi:hypothetical protein